MNKIKSGVLIISILLGLARPAGAATAPVLVGGSAPGQTPVGIATINPSSDLGSAVGVACAVRGDVTATLPGQPSRTLKSGTPVFMGEKIETGDKGHLQILLRDETSFTLGAQSSMVVDKFVFNTDTRQGEVRASIAKGVFRFITGQVAKKNPSKMTVKLPVGTIGIRGTMVTGDLRGDSARIVLLGPGDDNNIGERPGSIDVRNEKGSEEISEAGFGTTIENENSAPTDAKKISEEQLSELTEALQPPAEEPVQEDTSLQDNGTGNQNPNQEPESEDHSQTAGNVFGFEEGALAEEAGQDIALGNENANSTADEDVLEQFLDDVATESSTQALSAKAASSTTAVADGTATLAQLRTISSGQFHYSQSSVSLLNGATSVGNYTINFDIDFAAQTVGGGHSQITGNASTIDSNDSVTFALASQSFATGSGNASFSYTSIADTGGTTRNQASANVTIDLQNSGGTIAATAAHSITVTQSTNTVTGGGTASRENGLS